MDIKSLNEYVKFDNEQDLYNLFEPVFETRNVFLSDIRYNNYIVGKYQDMRIDLIFRDMYNLEGSVISEYLEDIDVILFINNIDNALNIKEGMLLKYPIKQSDLIKFRVSDTQKEQFNKNKITEKLVVPNKSTRKDTSRENFKGSGYSLPPVVLETPKAPVRIEDGKFTIGGL
jgi:hypothetical protein